MNRDLSIKSHRPSERSLPKSMTPMPIRGGSVLCGRSLWYILDLFICTADMLPSAQGQQRIDTITSLLRSRLPREKTVDRSSPFIGIYHGIFRPLGPQRYHWGDRGIVSLKQTIRQIATQQSTGFTGLNPMGSTIWSTQARQ